MGAPLWAPKREESGCLFLTALSLEAPLPLGPLSCEQGDSYMIY